jgi:hypothetical protein
MDVEQAQAGAQLEAGGGAGTDHSCDSGNQAQQQQQQQQLGGYGATPPKAAPAMRPFPSTSNDTGLAGPDSQPCAHGT